MAVKLSLHARASVALARAGRTRSREQRMPQVRSADVGDIAPGRWPDAFVLSMPGVRGAARSSTAAATAGGFRAAWRRAGVPMTKSLLSAEQLRQQIRVRLREYRLPAITGSVYKTHQGTGRPCMVCRREIERTQTEYEVEGAGVVLIAHELCHTLWSKESVSHRRSACSRSRTRPLRNVNVRGM